MKKIIISILSIILLVGLISEAFLVSAVPTDKDNLEKITFIHYKDGKVKAINHNAKPGTSGCYKLLGVKWTSTTPITYAINPTNSGGLSVESLTNAIFLSAEEWDKYTNKELFNNVPEIDNSATFNYVSPDYKNSYVFGEYSVGIIAVTNIWYTRVQKAIVDYDVLFNTYYAWGDATSNSLLMDVQNIATHETGHGIGLGDLYNSCVLETMYGYSDNGETSKRNLNSGDIAGLRKIYGY